MTILTRSEPLYIFGDVGHCAVSVTDTWWVRAKSAHKHPRPILPTITSSAIIYRIRSGNVLELYAHDGRRRTISLSSKWTRSDVKVVVLGPDMSTVSAASETIYEPLENSHYIYLTVSHFKTKIQTILSNTIVLGDLDVKILSSLGIVHGA